MNVITAVTSVLSAGVGSTSPVMSALHIIIPAVYVGVAVAIAHFIHSIVTKK